MLNRQGKSFRIAIVLVGTLLLGAPGSARAILVAPSIDSKPQHHAYVLSQKKFTSPWMVEEFPITPDGRMRVLEGPLTGFCNHERTRHPITSLAISPLGSLYVSGFFGPNCEPGIEAFAPGASGNVRPILRIQGDNTRLRLPMSMAFDRFGRLYVSQGQISLPRRAPGQVDVFAANAHGNVAPIAILIGARTRIKDRDAVYVAVDTSGAIFVAQLSRLITQVLKFAPGSHGDVAPLAETRLTLGSQVTEMQAGDDTVYVSMGYGPSVGPTVYKLRTSNLEIKDMMNSPDFNDIHAAADEEGRVYVQTITGSYQPSTLFIYPPNSNTPKRAIANDVGGGGYVVVGP